MTRRRIPNTPPLTVGVMPSGEEVTFPSPQTQNTSGGGTSRATVRGMIRRAAVAGAPARAIVPVFDTATDSGGPDLSYKALAGDGSAQIVIRGENLTGITVVDADTVVQVGGNTGTAPVVGTLVVTDTSITVPLDATNSTAGDFWGIILRDADGNVYGAPSPLKIFVGI